MRRRVAMGRPGNAVRTPVRRGGAGVVLGRRVPRGRVLHLSWATPDRRPCGDFAHDPRSNRPIGSTMIAPNPNPVSSSAPTSPASGNAPHVKNFTPLVKQFLDYLKLEKHFSDY